MPENTIGSNKYVVGEKLIARHPDPKSPKAKPVTAIVTRVERDPFDRRPYFTEASDGTKKWWKPLELTAAFKRASEATADENADNPETADENTENPSNNE